MSNHTPAPSTDHLSPRHLSPRRSSPRRRAALTVAAAAMVAAPLFATGEASAREDATPHEKSTWTDAEYIAKQADWDVESTHQLLQQQQAFGDLLHWVAVKHGRYYTGASFSEKPGAPATIYVTEARPGLVKRVEREMEKLGNFEIQIRDGAKYNLRQLKRRSINITKALQEQGQEDMASAIMADGTILVSVNEGQADKVKLPRHLRDGVKLAEAPGRVSNDEVDVKGGVQVYGNGGQCTSGFSVRKISNGVTGISTAAHCTGMNRINTPGPDTPMFFQQQHNGHYGDVEWHTTNEPEVDNYIAGPGDERDVSFVWPANAYAENMWTCVHSRMQNQRSCDRIYSTNVAARGARNLIATDNDNTVGGDSGGPWSWGGIADGIHKGDKWIWFGTRNVFSKADLMDEALGVRVMT